MTKIRYYTWPAAFFVVGIVMFGFAMVTAYAPKAFADYNRGCERVGWGFLMSGYRTICDGPKRRDGSWDRERREWTPAHWVSGFCGYYYCSAGHPVGESTQRWETYPVTDATVLDGEPGWLSPGTMFIH